MHHTVEITDPRLAKSCGGNDLSSTSDDLVRQHSTLDCGTVTVVDDQVLQGERPRTEQIRELVGGGAQNDPAHTGLQQGRAAPQTRFRGAVERAIGQHHTP